jgi:hypothetical protein
MRCAAGPSATSRTTARPTVMPTPATAPCTARQNHSISMEVASAAPNDANAKASRPTITTRLRPSASETAPCHRAMMAKGAM